MSETKTDGAEAITFDELVAHGKAQGVPLHNGMPWSFDYKGHPITHETDDCYLIPEPAGSARFERGDVLVHVDGALTVCRARLAGAAAGLLRQLRLALCPVCGYMYGSPRPGVACSCDEDRAAIAKAEPRG